MQPTQTMVEESSNRLEVVAVVVEEFAVETTVVVIFVMNNQFVLKIRSG